MSIKFIKKGGIDTSDATATAYDLAKNKTAYVKGQKITGKLTAGDFERAVSDIYDDTRNNRFLFRANYLPDGRIIPSGNSIRLFTTRNNLASYIKLTADKIKKDETILGITGTYEGDGGSFPPDWSLIGYSSTPNSILDDFNYSKSIYDNWDNTQTNLQSKFERNSTLVIFPLVDCSNVTNMISMFNNCTNLKTVSQLNTENVTNMAYMFGACTNLKNIPQFNTSKCRNLNNFVVNVGESLTNESLNNILAMCINVDDNNYIGTKTLSAIGLTSAQVAVCQGLSNYQAFLDAGWTTGY